MCPGDSSGDIRIQEGTIAMNRLQKLPTTRRSAELLSNKPLIAGVAGGLAAIAWLLLTRDRQQQSRRYADQSEDRRNPLHFFLAGKNPMRRKIDMSGERPLFERRQSVYDAY